MYVFCGFFFVLWFIYFGGFLDILVRLSSAECRDAKQRRAPRGGCFIIIAQNIILLILEFKRNVFSNAT